MCFHTFFIDLYLSKREKISKAQWALCFIGRDTKLAVVQFKELRVIEPKRKPKLKVEILCLTSFWPKMVQFLTFF